VHTPAQGDLVLGWESAYTAQRCLGPPWNGRELVVFPRHLLSNVLSSWATLTRPLRSLLVTSDCVFFRGG
jgi:hypothetical protein